MVGWEKAESNLIRFRSEMCEGRRHLDSGVFRRLDDGVRDTGGVLPKQGSTAHTPDSSTRREMVLDVLAQKAEQESLVLNIQGFKVNHAS